MPLTDKQREMAQRQPSKKAIATLERQEAIKRILPDMKKDYGAGMSINAIAAKYKVARMTVHNYLGEEKGSGRDAAWRIIERRLPIIAQQVTAQIAKSKRVDDGLRILEKSGVFPAEPQAPTVIHDNRLQMAIQQLLPKNAVNPESVAKPDSKPDPVIEGVSNEDRKHQEEVQLS